MSQRRPNWQGLGYVGMGAGLLAIEVVTGLLFGFSLADILFVRDISFAWGVGIAHALMFIGVWVIIKPLLLPNEPGDI